MTDLRFINPGMDKTTLRYSRCTFSFHYIRWRLEWRGREENVFVEKHRNIYIYSVLVGRRDATARRVVGRNDRCTYSILGGWRGGGIDKARWKEELLGWEAEESRLAAGRGREKRTGEAGEGREKGQRDWSRGIPWDVLMALEIENAPSEPKWVRPSFLFPSLVSVGWNLGIKWWRSLSVTPIAFRYRFQTCKIPRLSFFPSLSLSLSLVVNDNSSRQILFTIYNIRNVYSKVINFIECIE